MIRSRSSLLIDAYGEELPEEGLQLFDLIANDGDIQHFAAGYIPSHWHKELELFILLEGCIQIGIGSRNYQLSAGDGCFINTEIIHSFTAKVSSPCTYRSFVFHPNIIGGAPGSVFDTAYVRPLLKSGISFLKFQKDEEDKFYFEQFKLAFQACVEEPYGYEFQIRNALSNILLHVQSKTPDNSGCAMPTIQEMRLKEMLSWIDRNLGNPISVSQIAATVNICPRECQRIFQQYIHYSPIEYIQRKRIYRAARQLSETDYPITAIALNCGFSTPSYFSKQFKALMGSTPNEYRSMVIESNKSKIGRASCRERV